MKIIPNKFSLFIFKYLNNKNSNIIIPVTFFLSVLFGFINIKLTLLCGSIFILLVFIKIIAVVLYNFQIKKYCRENKITMDQFNEQYIND